MDEAPIVTFVPNPANQPAETTSHIPPSNIELVISQHELRDPSSFGTMEPNFDEEIAQILLPLIQRSTEADDATDSAEDLALMKAMAAGFKDVQERYRQKWGKVQEECKSANLMEKNLGTKATSFAHDIV